MVASPVLRTGLALFLLVTVAGCYSYIPVIGEDLTAGDEVRLRLSAAASLEVSERVGQPIRSLEGPLLRETPDSLRVDVGWGAIYAGTVFEGRRDTLQFHRSQVLEVDRKQFSRSRTGLAIGAATAAIVAIVIQVRGGRGGQPRPGPDDPTFGIPPGR